MKGKKSEWLNKHEQQRGGNKDVAQSGSKLQRFTRGHPQHVAFLTKYHCGSECVSGEELQQFIPPAQSLL